MLRIKDVVRQVIRRCGYDVRPIASGSGSIRETLGECYEHLNASGFKPGTLVDVGVATGTPELYEAFPKAYFLLVEALKAFEGDLK